MLKQNKAGRKPNPPTNKFAEAFIIKNSGQNLKQPVQVIF
jgi:hypothetical protein